MYRLGLALPGGGPGAVVGGVRTGVGTTSVIMCVCGGALRAAHRGNSHWYHCECMACGRTCSMRSFGTDIHGYIHIDEYLEEIGLGKRTVPEEYIRNVANHVPLVSALLIPSQFDLEEVINGPEK